MAYLFQDNPVVHDILKKKEKKRIAAVNTAIINSYKTGSHHWTQRYRAFHFWTLHPERCASNLYLLLSNIYYGLNAWPLPMKSVPGECHRTPFDITLATRNPTLWRGVLGGGRVTRFPIGPQDVFVEIEEAWKNVHGKMEGDTMKFNVFFSTGSHQPKYFCMVVTGILHQSVGFAGASGVPQTPIKRYFGSTAPNCKSAET